MGNWRRKHRKEMMMPMREKEEKETTPKINI